MWKKADISLVLFNFAWSERFSEWGELKILVSFVLSENARSAEGETSFYWIRFL